MYRKGTSPASPSSFPVLFLTLIPSLVPSSSWSINSIVVTINAKQGIFLILENQKKLTNSILNENVSYNGHYHRQHGWKLEYIV